MKIELSEVFVTRTDAMTMEQIPSAVGIAGIEPRSNVVHTNTKCRRIPILSALRRFVTKPVQNQSKTRPKNDLHF